MLDTALHTGIEHPDLWWIAAPTFFAFLTGFALGSRSDRLDAWRERQTGTDDAR